MGKENIGMGQASLFDTMTTLQKHFIPTLLAVLFVAVSAGRTLAYDHDDKGWWDEHHVHHPFIEYNGHHGYWDHDQNGVRVFINVG